MTALSVIICSHNPRLNYLARVLNGLRMQTLANDNWELLVVDNASEQVLAKEWDLSWHPKARHVREDELGLSVARQRGMREAATDLLVFVDDDNVLEPDYLAVALRISSKWPQLGVWGGSMVPEFEVEPPGHLRKYATGLMVRERVSPGWSNIASCFDAQPCGAGLCVRSDVAAAYCRQYQESKVQLTDRSGRDLISGGDTEICYVACSIGFGMGLFPELSVTHLIPKERLSEAYLVKLAEGIQTSRLVLGFKWNGVLPPSPITPIELLRAMKNLVARGKLDRRMYLAGLRAANRARSIIATASVT